MNCPSLPKPVLAVWTFVPFGRRASSLEARFGFSPNT